MCTHAEHLLTAARYLRALVRQAGSPEELDDLQADIVAIAAAAWEDQWPAVLDAIVAPFEAAPPESEATQQQLDAGLAAAGASFPEGWPGDAVNAQLVETTARGYSLGKELVEEATRAVGRTTSRPLTGRGLVVRVLEEGAVLATFEEVLGPDRFGLADEPAAIWLANDTQFWVGNAWDEGLGKEIADTALLVLEEGGGAAEVGRRLQETLGPRFERSEDYWNVVGNATMQRSRNFGATQDFLDAGVSTYTIEAVMDERTSQVCETMNGTVFEVRHAVQLRDAYMEAESPEDVKAAAPWRQADAVAGIKALGPDAMATAGLSLPPYHGRCRTTVEVASFV